MFWRSIIFLSIFFSLFIAGAVSLLWTISALLCRLRHRHVPYAPFGYTALGLGLIPWILLGWGSLVGVWQFTQTQQTYVSEKVPESFDGYRIVHISDLHADTYTHNPQALDKIVAAINSLNPDIILFTGDMQTGNISSVYSHSSALRRLQARDGICSVLGNHDFFIYEKSSLEERLEMADSLTAFEHDTLGWTVLRNSNIILRRGSDSLAIAGVDNINGDQGFNTIQMGDLDAAVKGIDGLFTILLSHDPSYWTAEILPREAADITLSGHTHGSQVRLFGWSLARLAFRECDGRYDRNGRMLYVNAGLGCTAPFRIGCPSELTVITLKKD